MSTELVQVLAGIGGIALGSVLLLGYYAWQRRRDERRWKQETSWYAQKYVTRPDGTVYPAWKDEQK